MTLRRDGRSWTSAARSPTPHNPAKPFQHAWPVGPQPPLELSRGLDYHLSAASLGFERLRQQREVRGDLVVLEIVGELDRQAVTLAPKRRLLLSADQIAPACAAGIVNLL